MTLSVRVRKRLAAEFLLDVAFDVHPGVTIVFGESGSGKTTVLRAVAGLAQPDQGRIAVGDRVLFDSGSQINVRAAERRIGFVFQHLALFPHLTAAENIAYGLWRATGAEQQRATAAIAESFRIAHLLNRRPGEISGGERQRVGLARALVTNPEILLLDEPLSALDHGTQSRIIADLRSWNAAHGIPILYVTHSQREVFALGDRVVALQDGSVVAEGTPQQVMDAPVHEHLAQLAGFENLLDAVVAAKRPEAGTMVARIASTTVHLETPIAEVEVGRAVRIAIRAGDILIATERPHGISARNVIPGTIRKLTVNGTVMRSDVDVGALLEVHLTPLSSDELGLRPGSDVWLVIKTHSCRPVSAV